MNTSSLLRRATREASYRPAFILGSGARVTHAQVDAEADRVAGGLAEVGVQRGDRVAIYMQNIPHFAYAYFGIMRAGGVAVPLNPMLTAVEAERILVDSGAKVVLASDELDATAARAGEAHGVTIITPGRWSELGHLGTRVDDAEVAPDDLAVLAYTSGTTGDPRGAMLSHGNLQANLDQQLQVPGAEISSDDVLLMTLPLSHIFGLNVTLGQVVANAATGVLVERFDAAGVLDLVAAHGITVLFGSPTMYRAFLEVGDPAAYDLSSVRLAVSGAAPLPAQVLEEFKDVYGVDIFEGYGLTETSPTLTSGRMADAPKPGSVGKPIPGVEIRLIDDQGNEAEIGDPGEVVVSGPNVFQGYWNRFEETAAVLSEGWFRTGDIAVRDEQGFLYLVDRKRDLILVSGFNVYPAEVEAALVENPKVREACVIGVPHDYTGEAVKAFVVLEPGAEATEAELLADVETRLARFKCPRSIEIVKELPHLPAGKVLRRKLREGNAA